MGKVLLWDLDGTLLDSFGVFSEVFSDILPSYDRVVPSEEVMRRNFHGSLEDSIRSAVEGASAGEVAAILADFLVAQDTYYEVIEEHIFTDAMRLVNRAYAADYTQILVTNREHEGRLKGSPRHIVANSDLSDFIDAVICGDDSEHRKPKPEVLGDLASQLRGSDVIVVGDQYVDAQFALNLNANGILVHREAGDIVHLNRLSSGWEKHISIVASLDDVKLP